MRHTLRFCSLVGCCILWGCSAGKEANDTGTVPSPAVLEQQGVGSVAGDVTLENTRWQLVELNGEGVTSLEGKQHPYFILNSDTKRLDGFGGCNRMGGAYTAAGDSLRLGPLLSTQMACPGPEMDLEQGFFQALGGVRAWKIEGGKLSLHGGGRVLAKLVPW